MIQAVADEEERSVLGMHYTSVPNILKVLNPLFLDDLRAELEAAGDNARKLANLRARMAKIRVFAYMNEKQEMVLDAFVRALSFFGGVPRRVIIDNPKSRQQGAIGSSPMATVTYVSRSKDRIFHPRFLGSVDNQRDAMRAATRFQLAA